MESARTHASAFVAETEIEELPIAGRRYLRLAELTPVITQDAATGGVSVMDLPSAQNRILIDGFDHTSSITGDPIGREGPSRDQDQDLVFARTDHEYFRQHLTLRYVDQQFAGQAVDATRFQPAISSDGRAYLRTRSGAGSLASALGSKIVNEARVQYADSHDAENPATTPAVVVWQGGSFVAQTGSSLFGPHTFATKQVQMADSV